MVRRAGLVVGVVLAGLVVGGAAGWAVAEGTRGRPVSSTTRPLTAQNPAVPTGYLASSKRAALGTGLPLVPDHVTSTGTRWDLVRPDGWERKVVERGIRWVLPGDPDWTYSVRVVPTGSSGTVTAEAEGRLADLRQSVADGALADLELVGLTSDTLAVTYVQDGHLKYQHTQFVPASATSPTAVFEVSTSGRLEDRAGLDDLAQRMAASVERA